MCQTVLKDSAARCSNRFCELMLFCDTLLVEMWKENARSCRNFRCIFKLFLPEAWKLDSDRERKRKQKLKGFGFPNCFQTLFTSDLISSWHLLDPDELQQWNYHQMGSKNLKWVNEVGISKRTHFIPLCSLWWNVNLRLTISILLHFSFQSIQKGRLF